MCEMRTFFLAISAICAVQEILCSTPSGLYVDNGLDQTVIEHSMTIQERQDIELEILHLLGLPDRPRTHPSGLPGDLQRSAPRFLMDVYKSLVERENGREERSADDMEVELSGDERNAIEESDVIMTFENKYKHVNVLRHERGKRFWFNVSDIPASQSIVGAELRIFKNSHENRKKSDAVYTVTAYQLINTEDGERELEYITAVNTTGDFDGWLELNLTSCLANWVVFPESNKGLYLSVHPLNRPAHEVRPEDVGLLVGREDDEVQPFMVAFLKATNHVNVRRSRSIRKTRRSDYPILNSHDSNYKSSMLREQGRSCRVHTLHINFKDLKWQDWIIAPEAYGAYFCDGECNFPLNAQMNATNHAIVQTLVHLISLNRYPKPCCAPTKLNPISVLYYNEDSNVILKKYKKMVVKSCGCH